MSLNDLGNFIVKRGKQYMDSSEKRMIGSLLLLLGFTLLTIGLYTGQFAAVLDIIKKGFTVSILGVL